MTGLQAPVQAPPVFELGFYPVALLASDLQFSLTRLNPGIIGVTTPSNVSLYMTQVGKLRQPLVWCVC